MDSLKSLLKHEKAFLKPAKPCETLLPAFINHFTKPSLLIFAITNIVYLCQATLSHILGRREHTHLIASIWNVRRRQRGVCLMTHRTPRIRTVRLHTYWNLCMYVCTNTHTAVCTKLRTCSHFCQPQFVVVVALWMFIFVAVAVAIRGVCVKKCVASVGVGAGAALSQMKFNEPTQTEIKYQKQHKEWEKHNNAVAGKIQRS